MKAFWRGFISFLPIILSSASLAQNPPTNLHELLAKVAESVRHNSYRGRLTYEHSGKLEVLEIVHSVVDGIEHQRVFYLNGPDRELVKNGRKVGCVTPGSHLLSGGIIEAADGMSVASIESAYNIKLLGSERVAGRDSWVLQLVPRDQHRHSFVIGVDQDSYLPTKTLFVASGGKPLERLHFISLDISTEHIGDDAELSVEESVFDGADTTCGHSEALVAGSSWQPAWIPPGFVLSHYDFTDVDGHMETYTDGLASFSVVARPVNSPVGQGLLPRNTSYKKGATVVVMGMIANSALPVHISVVGEIPNDTAKRILSSVREANL